MAKMPSTVTNSIDLRIACGKSTLFLYSALFPGLRPARVFLRNQALYPFCQDPAAVFPDIGSCSSHIKISFMLELFGGAAVLNP